MSKVPEYLFEEARKRGIVPGAWIHSAASGTNSKAQQVVPFDQWIMYVDELNNGPAESGYYLTHRGKWAEVAVPAPSQAVGLKEGDAIDCGPAMRAAIIELAKELGLSIVKNYAESSDYTRIVWFWDQVDLCVANYRPQNIHTPEEFIAKMRVTATLPKPIMIGDRTVKFNSDQSITVGCTTVSFATIEEVYNRLKKS